MKTLITSVALSMVLFQQVRAQGFYAGIYGGYAKAIMPEHYSNYSASSTYNYGTGDYFSSSSVEKVNSNFGSGAGIGLKVGYAFNPYVAFEASYYRMQNSVMEGKYSSTSTDIDPNYGIETEYRNSAMSFHSGLQTVTPSIVLTYPSKSINTYMRAGLLIGFATQKYSEVYSRISSNTEYYLDEEITFKGSANLGFTGAIGLRKNLSSGFSLFAELNMNALTFYPKKSVITKYTVNGVDQLPDMTTYEKETEYVESYSSSYSSSSNANTSQPRKEIGDGFSYSSVGLTIGLIYCINQSQKTN